MYNTDEVRRFFLLTSSSSVMKLYIVHHWLRTFVIQDGHYKESASGEIFHECVV